MRISISGSILCLALCSFGAKAEDRDNEEPWSKWATTCNNMNFKKFREFVQGAREWESQLDPAHSKIQHLTDVTCKEFVGKNMENSTDILRSFVAERDLVTLTALTLEKEGEANQQYLEKNFLDVNKFTRSLGIKFEDYKCGQGFLERRSTVASKVKQLRAQMVAVQQKCMRPADSEDPAPALKKITAKGAGAPTGKAADFKRRQPASSSSTISGDIPPQPDLSQ